MSASHERSRRPSEEVRALLLSAAMELFLDKGYAGTTTKEIATRAGVSEPLIFTNYENKAGLFRATIVGGFEQFAADYVQLWKQIAPGSTDQSRVEGFVRGLLDLTERHRAILISAIGHPGGSVEAEVLGEVAQAFQRMHELEAPAAWHFDPAAILAATVGMVMSTVLLDGLLFPAGAPRPDRETMVAELTRVILHGVSHELTEPIGGR